MIKWLGDGGLSVPPPKKLKKITGTRFGAILDKNPWHTAFEMWCEITRTYEKPYEDNIYTKAGKVIESKQLDYAATYLGNVVRPEQMYGKDFFKTTHGDFFPNDNIFGGMWDALLINEDRKAVIECKTTKRAEDWTNDIPEYYALQASLYAYLLGYDEVIFVTSILTDADYNLPQNYEVSVSNTFRKSFKVSERYPDFDKMIDYCINFYHDMCLTGMSPIPGEQDAELLKQLHTEFVDPDAETEELMAEFERLHSQLAKVKQETAEIDKRYKKITAELKRRITDNASDNARFELKGTNIMLTFTPTQGEGIDTDKLKADGIYDKYKIMKPITYIMRTKEIKNDG